LKERAPAGGGGEVAARDALKTPHPMPAQHELLIVQPVGARGFEPAVPTPRIVLPEWMANALHAVA